jgi:hypothetical protein
MEKNNFHTLWKAADLFLATICNRVFFLRRLSSEGTDPAIFLQQHMPTKKGKHQDN